MWANRKEGDKVGLGPSTETGYEGNDPREIKNSFNEFIIVTAYTSLFVSLENANFKW